MEMKQRICLLLAVLLGLSRVLPADATDDAAAYLPLAVGNSWTYAHEYSNFLGTFDSPRERYSTYYRWPARGFNSPHEWYSTYYRWPARANELPYPHGRLVSITVQGTEVIDGKTYYVLSDLPDNWPPAPSYFIAGKKLRWAGTHLRERTVNGERSVFRFDGANDAGYSVETDGVSSPIKRQGWFEYMELAVEVEPDGVDNLITVRLSSPDPSRAYLFDFRGTEQGNGSCEFRKNYGCVACVSAIFSSFKNNVFSVRAVLGGRTVEYKDLLTPTSTSIPSSSWGQVKEEVH